MSKKGLLVLFIIFLVIGVALGIYFGPKLLNKDNKEETKTEEKQEEKKEEKKEESKGMDEYSKYLVDAQYIVKDPTTGARLGSGFIFLEDGTYIYFSGTYLPRFSGEILGHYGTWTLKDKVLTIESKEMVRTNGGDFITDDVEGQVLGNYQVEKTTDGIVLEFNIVEFEDSDVGKCIKLDDGDYLYKAPGEMSKGLRDEILSYLKNGYGSYDLNKLRSLE